MSVGATPTDVFDEYERLSALVPALADGPGRTTTLGWDLEYAAPDTLIAFLDQIVFRRMTEFATDNPAPVILDCGANVGYTVLHYKRHYPSARIIAFEPDPFFAPMLRRNLARNGAGDVRVVEAAAWTADGRATWIAEGKDGSRLATTDAASSTIDVATVDLRTFLDSDVDLLKVDVEGAEFDVLPHIAPALGRVRNILVECHLVDQTAYPRLSRVIDLLTEAGFRISLNTYGPWRDLTRRHVRTPHHYEQYMLLSGWRDESPGVSPEVTYAPYVGIAPFAIERERQRLAASNAELSASVAMLADYVARPDAYQVHRLSPPFRRERGLAWLCALPESDRDAALPCAGSPSAALLIEDGAALGPGASLHDDVRAMGRGRYSHWGSQLYFSSSDNSDPNANGRSYVSIWPRRS